MNPETVFIGTNGKIGAYKLKFNDEKIHELEKHEWTQELKGAGYHLISMVLTGVNGVLYAATNGHIYCIDPLDGKIRWEKQPGNQKGLFKSDLVYLAHLPETNHIYVAGSGWVVCLDGKTGDFIWESKVTGIMGKNNSVTLLIVKSFILVGVNGFVHALDLKTGNEVWKNDLAGKGYGPVTLGYYSFEQHGTYSEELIIVGCNGYLESIDVNSGATRSSYNMKGTGYHVVALVVDSKSNTVFAATYGQVYALNPQSFHLKWKSDLPGMGYSHGFGLKYHEEKVYVGIQGKVACLDAKDGNMLWKDSLDGSGFDIVTLAVHHHTLLAMSNGRFYGIDMKNGKTIWKDSLSGMGYSPGSVSTAYSNTDFNSTTISGHIEALREEAARAAATSH